jgi:hypothetical protein
MTSDPHKKAKDKLKETIARLECLLVVAESEGNKVSANAIKKVLNRLKKT